MERHKNFAREKDLSPLKAQRMWAGKSVGDEHAGHPDSQNGQTKLEDPEKMEKTGHRKRAVLLECVSNLTANEMFGSSMEQS